MPSKSLRIGEYSESHLLKTSKNIIQDKTKGCLIFSKDAEDRIPRFDSSELTVGRVLGRGGFCVVSEITKVTLKDGSGPFLTRDDNVEDDYQIVQDRDFMQAHYIRKGKDARYAIKRISDDLLKDPQAFVNGIIDLALEVKFLSVIRHPNIIKMRAVEMGTPYSRDFFVVLDRLYETLYTRLAQWKKRAPGGLKRLMDRKGKKQMAFWLERIAVAHDLAFALKYLHSLNVMYRDLKPDNIGFDVRGDVKIFDFGLAKEFHPSKADRNGCYKLTGETGSIRYMAPEVGLSKPYNETVDVYSFGILLYQILALETPFQGLTVKSFNKMVYVKGARPVPDSKWPESISSLMSKCWSANIKARPSMGEVASVLMDEMNKNSDEEIVEIMDASRKSEISLRDNAAGEDSDHPSYQGEDLEEDFRDELQESHRSGFLEQFQQESGDYSDKDEFAA